MSGTLIYLLAACASAVCCILLLTRSRNGDITRRGALACAIGAAWALVLAGQSWIGVSTSWAALLGEASRYGGWLLVLRALLPLSPGWLKRGQLALVLAVAVYALLGWIGEYSARYSLPLTRIQEVSGLLLAFSGLVATEQVMRNAPETQSRLIRLCSIGIGGQFAYDLFLYSQAQLLGAIDPGAWAVRGAVAATLLIPFTLAVWRMPPAEPRVFVSRHVVFYTSAFVAVGLYLCLMAFGGYYVREQGGSWGNALQVAFLCGAIGILALLLVSDSPLRRLRVFIATHFYRNKYDYRIEWMRFVQTLSAADEPDIHRTAIRAVAQIFGSPGGLLMLREEGTRRFALRASWPESFAGQVTCGDIDAGEPLPRFLHERQWVIDLREFQEKPSLYGDLQLPHWLEAPGSWRVIAPLLMGNELLGFMLLRSPPEPFAINFEDRDLLKTVGRNVAVQLAQHRADEKLAQSRQFDAYNRFAAFVMHDLKNSAAQLQLLVGNAARHRNNPVFVDDAIGTIANTAERMTRLIEQLQGKDLPAATREVDLVALARVAASRAAARAPAVTQELPENQIRVLADPERLAAVIEHVIRNAQEATAPEGQIMLRLQQRGGEAYLHVIDAGAGMDAEFLRHRLFRPFDSTKGSKGMGIGVYQTREYARLLGGDVEVQSTPGVGTDFCIRLPLCQTNDPNS